MCNTLHGLACCCFIGTACRTRATFALAKHFSSPLEAHEYYTKNVVKQQTLPKRVRLHSKSTSTQTEVNSSGIIDEMISLLLILPEDEQLHAINNVFQVMAARSYPTVVIPNDFVQLCLKSMERLKQVGRYNVVYGLVQGLGTMREDKSDSRFPTLRMPMGLMEYMVSFYSAHSINQVIYAAV